MTLPGRPPAVADGTRTARLVRVDRSAWHLLSDAGPLVVPPLAVEATVGDWLVVDDGPNGPVATSVLPRRTLLARGTASGTSRRQLLAADVDVVVVLAPLSAAVNVRRVERLLTLAWESGATPVVALTKADLHPDPAAAVRDVEPHAPGAAVVTVAAAVGDVDALRPYAAPGATLVLLGASGAGKSTVVNALAGAPVMGTGDVRDVDGKGRHTTTHRELVVLPSGAVVIDTPGLRGVALAGSEEGLAKAFSDVEELAAACRFADCSHVGEPGCAVQASVDAGDLTAERMASWHKLQRELAWQARRTDQRLRAEEKAKWKAVHKAQRVRGYRP